MIMAENNILGFDPQTLEIFNNNIEQDDTWIKEIEERRNECVNKKFDIIHVRKVFPIDIYLAGKISSNGWRQSIVDIRNNVMVWGDYNIDYFKSLRLHYKDDFFINGPFFLSCDHSCYHGEGNHGVGILHPVGCYCERTFTQKEVNDICLTQIKNADVLFAYIDDDTCYGSIYEIGYAAANNIPIIILFDSVQRYKDMWFIAQNAKIVDYVDDDEKDNFKIKERFDKLIDYIKND